MSNVTILGKPLFSMHANGKLTSAILTAFPHFGVIVTRPKPHAFQIEDFVEWLNGQRLAKGLPPMSFEEEQKVRQDAVAGVIDGDCIQIRPDPHNMPLAFQADKLLQRFISKRRIKFLNVLNTLVRDALKRRGECWRIARLPTCRSEIKARILRAKTAIGGQEIYYYNATTGTRWLTYHQFSRLGELDDGWLRSHLAEIQHFSRKVNPQHNPEIAFYMAGTSFTTEALADGKFLAMASEELRAAYERLQCRFRDSVPPNFQEDDLESSEWRHRMFSTLVTETEEIVQEEVLLSLSPEFFMQIHWLPGGRMVNGELAFDEVFEEDCHDPCEENAREFLYNLLREYEDLEYVNIGQVVNSLSRRRPCPGRREVYIAVLKRCGCPRETVSILRMQKWGVREHLNEHRSLPEAQQRSDEYTEYVLDRRFACRYLGMNLPRRVTARKICERYFAEWTGPTGYMIWSPYFERMYIDGIATDKMPRGRFQDRVFAREFARLLGQAAASNLIVGRCDAEHKVLFDDGDEILLEDAEGMPIEIVVADQTGTCCDYRSPLPALAAAYADPVNRRIDYLPDPEGFARAYLEAFMERFSCIQKKYRGRRRAFETLFRTRPYDELGCFVFRWQQVLKRLDQTDPSELADLITANLQFRVETH